MNLSFVDSVFSPFLEAYTISCNNGAFDLPGALICISLSESIIHLKDAKVAEVLGLFVPLPDLFNIVNKIPCLPGMSCEDLACNIIELTDDSMVR